MLLCHSSPPTVLCVFKYIPYVNPLSILPIVTKILIGSFIVTTFPHVVFLIEISFADLRNSPPLQINEHYPRHLPHRTFWANNRSQIRQILIIRRQVATRKLQKHGQRSKSSL